MKSNQNQPLCTSCERAVGEMVKAVSSRVVQYPQPHVKDSTNNNPNNLDSNVTRTYQVVASNRRTTGLNAPVGSIELVPGEKVQEDVDSECEGRE